MTCYDAFLLDFVEEQIAENRQMAESNAVLAHLPEDDDYGDRDGDDGGYDEGDGDDDGAHDCNDGDNE